MTRWDETTAAMFAANAAAFAAALAGYGATDEEVTELVETTDLTDVIDEDALAHDQLSSLRRVPSV